MTAELVVARGPEEGRAFKLQNNEITLGRDGCDVTINDHLISRVQARLLWVQDGYDIEDLGSRNGTFVNAVRISRARLKDCDEILVGHTLLLYRENAHSHETQHEIDPHLTEMPGAITLNARESEIFTADLDERDLHALQRAKLDLAAIYRAGQIINAILDSEKLCSQVLDIVLQEMPQTDICSILLLNEHTGELDWKSFKAREGSQHAEEQVFSTSILRSLLDERKAVLTYDAQHDGRFNVEESIVNYRIRSAMCVPLQSRDRILGALQAHTLIDQHRFGVADLKLLTAIGMQAGTALENAGLYEKLSAEKAALHDAHERLKATQETLIQSEKMAAVGRLAAGFVHDVKNPMTVILGRTELLRMLMEDNDDEPLETATLRENLDEIRDGVAHCNEVCNQLLQFARQSTPHKINVDVNKLVQETVSFLGHEVKKKKASVCENLQPGIHPITVDAHQLKQVLINIILNGLQALTKDGIITIHTYTEDPDLIVICIEDNGEGMTSDVRERLFEPFFSTKKAGTGPGGSGLGLSVSYGIIQNHGGTIDVESTLGSGSKFFVKLPLSSKTAASSVSVA